jgi:PEGA domain
VNGALVGSTPLELDNLPVGSRAVRIEADGYQRWSASARIVANQQTRLTATLARAKS